MRYKFICLLLVYSFCFWIKGIGQAGPGYTPGNVLRIDFEGRHRFLDHAASPSPAYQAGPALRVDFAGNHRIVDHNAVQTPAYQPGAPLRIDFEGMHRMRLTNKIKN